MFCYFACLHIKQSVCQIYNMLKYIKITSNQYLFRNFEFCFFLFVFNKSASIPTLLNITLWNHKNYESGNQNSENTISRIQDSYFLYQLVVLDYQLKNVSKNICFASQTKSTVLLIGYGIRKEEFMSKLEPDPNDGSELSILERRYFGIGISWLIIFHMLSGY